MYIPEQFRNDLTEGQGLSIDLHIRLVDCLHCQCQSYQSLMRRNKFLILHHLDIALLHLEHLHAKSTAEENRLTQRLEEVAMVCHTLRYKMNYTRVVVQ
jgi:hypothetical protein